LALRRTPVAEDIHPDANLGLQTEHFPSLIADSF